MRSKCGYDGVHPYWDWTQGNDPAKSDEFSPDPNVDTADFYHATIFSDSDYDGLGSWGDPKDDFQICTGGLKDLRVAYPVPHRIRRNYTLQPFLVGAIVRPEGAPPIDPSLMLNTTFTKENVSSIVNSFTGDYIHFQSAVEVTPGPHPGPHSILGGDMGGACPFGLTSPTCYPGPKWAPNGENNRYCICTFTN